MKTVSSPRQKEGAVLPGLDEGGVGERVVILAHGVSCDDALGEHDSRVAFMSGPRDIQQGVFTCARGPYDKHETAFEV